MEPKHDGMCFACGPDNPIGLRLRYEVLDGGTRVRAECLPDPAFQGWDSVLHGGILAAMLDETISKVGVALLGGMMLTARLEVRYRKPVPIGRKVVLEGRLLRRRGDLIEARAEARLDDGTLVAEATGKCMRAKGR